MALPGQGSHDFEFDFRAFDSLGVQHADVLVDEYLAPSPTPTNANVLDQIRSNRTRWTASDSKKLLHSINYNAELDVQWNDVAQLFNGKTGDVRASPVSSSLP